MQGDSFRTWSDTEVILAASSFSITEWLFGGEEKVYQIRKCVLSGNSRISTWLDRSTVKRLVARRRTQPTWNLAIRAEWL
jgi:hypothetical protein